MGIRLSEDEAWAKIAASHTGIITTLRRDGRPVPLPLWFAVVDRAIYFGTPSRSKKVARIRNDDRASFLVESGEAWVELSAVVLQGVVREVTDDAERERARAALDEKYEAFRVPMDKVPGATKDHYNAGMMMFRLDVVEKMLTWDNARIPIGGAASS